MIDKDELIVKLQRLGYETVMDNRVPCILVDEMPDDKQKKKYIKLMDELGYNASWGIIKKQHENRS